MKPRNPAAPVAPHLFQKNDAFKTYLDIKKTFTDI
jgi:hypothetical protein